MAKPTQFSAYQFRRKKAHKLPSPPSKISESKLRAGTWAAQKTSPSARVSKKKQKEEKKKKVPKRAIDVLRCADQEVQCLHCGRFGDDPACGNACYKAFRREHLTPAASLIDIRGPGPLGYTAFTKPGASIEKGQYVGEYLGELLPLDHHPTDAAGLYRYEIPGVCAVDAEQAGNWTRFMNSSCEPNVKPWGDFVGKRHVIVFQALRNIGGEEELTFNYGRRYFEKAGFSCGCAAREGAHMPGDAKKAKKVKKA